jgi:hypothetical protein
VRQRRRNSLILKSVPKKLDDSDFFGVGTGESLIKSQKFLKIYSDGNGNYSNVITVP